MDACRSRYRFVRVGHRHLAKINRNRASDLFRERAVLSKYLVGYAGPAYFYQQISFDI